MGSQELSSDGLVDSPPYEYLALNYAAKRTTGCVPSRLEFQLRTISLKPSEDLNAPLHCEIHHRNVTAEETYEAISYAWGPAVFDQRLFCDAPGGVNTTVIRITSSLNQALKAFRLRDKTRILWADAVCINQNDPVEKTIQVSHMGHIYAYASAVLVWLGEGDDISPCLDFLWGLSSSGHEHCATTEHANAVIKYELMRAFKHTNIEPVVKFFSNPWFSRRWVIQEAGLARRCVYRYDKHEIDTHAFGHALYILGLSNLSFDRGVLSRITNIELVAQEHENRSKLTTYGQRGILDLLILFNEALGADDRDRIAALMTLADDFGDPPWDNETPGILPRLVFKVDYTVPVEVLYLIFATKMMTHKKHLEVLHCAGAFRRLVVPGQGDTTLPSWVPDWRNTLQFVPLLNVPWFKAGITDDNRRPNPQERSCRITGIVIGSVNVVQKLCDGSTVESDRSCVMEMLVPLCNAIGMLGRYLTGEYVWQALATTLVADHALNSTIRKRYAEQLLGKNTLGRRMKRSARVRDAQVLLDWWTHYRETQDPSWSLKFPGRQNGQPIDEAQIQELVEQNWSTVQRDGPMTLLVKSGDASYHWAHSSAQEKSKRHVRVEEEDLPYIIDMLNDKKKNFDAESGTDSKMDIYARLLRGQATADDFMSCLGFAETAVKKTVPRRIRNKGAINIRRNTNGDIAKLGGEADEIEDDRHDAAFSWQEDAEERKEEVKDQPKVIEKGPTEPVNDELYVEPGGEWRVLPGGLIYLDPDERNTERYVRLLNETVRGRSVFITDDGFIGLGPGDMKEGDTVAIIDSARTPFILRPAVNQKSWVIIGDCYVHGLMMGEAMRLGTLERTSFEIV